VVAAAGDGERAGRAGWVVAAVGGVPVCGLAFAQGGYFATAWGWAALALLWLAAVALLVRPRLLIGRLDVVFVGGLAGLVAWVLVSRAWSLSPSESVLEAQRGLVYVAGAAALVLVADRTSASWLLGGLLAAITVVSGYALVTRLFPGVGASTRPLGQYRLAEPLGYWNALGLLAAIGAVLAVAFAATATRRAARALAGALPVLFTPTLYFTFGRAAWLALAAGLAVVLLMARGRRPAMIAAIVVAVPWSISIVALAAGSAALNEAGAPAAEAADQGRRLAAAVGALGVLAALSTLAQPRLAAALERLPRPRVRLAVAGSAAAFLVLAAVTGVVVAGGPGPLVDRADRGFSTPPAPTGGELRRRLFTTYGEGRAAAWRVAWDAARERPVAGIGAGSFEQRWLAVRPRPQGFRDVHNLYLETLAELGLAGLVLLAAALAAPAVGAWRAREHPVAPAAAGGLAAYLTHAAFDWDWEMPAVTMAMLVCGAAALALARPQRAWAVRWPARGVGVTAATVLAAAAIVGVVGNGAVGASIAALRGGDFARAEHEAAKATKWAPWSTEPWRWMGEARLARDDAPGARRAFRDGLDREPRNWALWYGLALASAGAERRQALARAGALNPLSPEVRHLTGASDR
jgi:hypothetical protein